MMVGVKNWPSTVITQKKSRSREEAPSECRLGHHSDHEENHEHRDRSDNRNEIQRRGQRAESDRIRHSGQRANDAGQRPDAEVDQRYDQKIVGQSGFDLIEDLENRQPRIAACERHDETAPQVRPF